MSVVGLRSTYVVPYETSVKYAVMGKLGLVLCFDLAGSAAGPFIYIFYSPKKVAITT